MDTQKEETMIWGKVLNEVELIISRANFITWFQNTKLDRIDNGVVFLNVPNSFTREWIKNKYSKSIINIIRKMDPTVRAIEYLISNTPMAVHGAKAIFKNTVALQEKNKDTQLEFETISETKDSLNPKYTFDNFVVGSFNELAHAAAMAVVNNPGTLYNPLFIYGGVGLGKTHLLQAIGNKIKEKYSALNIKYTTSERFANGIINSLQNNKTYEFKETYKKYDFLIMDDVQFLSGKTKTREEFFHIFNILHENNKQIIFSSDRPPRAIPDLEERLRSRFEGGMLTDISEPEFEARIAILKSKIQQKNLVLDDESIEYIASIVKNNIRELEGSLNIISAQVRLQGKNIPLTEIKKIIEKNNSYNRKKVTFTKLIKTIADFYEIKEQYIFEKTRKKECVLPRQIAMYLLRADFNASYPYIGQKFNGRDHTTVIHAYEKIDKNLKTNQQLKEEIQKIRNYLYQ